MSKLNIYNFGHELLKLNDLDPVYVLLWASNLPTTILRKWLLAYWCYYHVGTAGWVCSQKDYWSAMITAAGSKTYPRSSERRHYRGGQALRSVQWLRSFGIDSLFAGFKGLNTATKVMEYVKTWKGFGPWISFKAADMLERLAIQPVQFTVDEAMYESPLQSAVLLWQTEGSPAIENGAIGRWAVARILQELKGLKAPPRYERALNVQEAETILCKWKSYMGGHYHLGEDVAAVRTGLSDKFGKYVMCRRMLVEFNKVVK